MTRTVLMLILLGAAIPGAKAETGIQLSLPIACTLGTDCFIQQYADVDPGPEERDYHCGGETYDGHTGTDFRVISPEAAARGVPVLASAPGKVRSMRDGVEDRLIASREDIAALNGLDCGNAVVIDHGGGWETQYCHMKRGSVRVRSGDTVAAGAPLGLVGYSGNAQFAHVHLTVWRDRRVVDPFSGKAQGGTCNTEDADLSASLWAPELRPSLIYVDSTIIEVGFSSGAASPGGAQREPVGALAATSPGLVFYARLINLRKGDSLRLTASGPGNFKAASSIPAFERRKAEYIGFAGKKLTGKRWPSGRYQGRVEVVHGENVIGRREATFDMP